MASPNSLSPSRSTHARKRKCAVVRAVPVYGDGYVDSARSSSVRAGREGFVPHVPDSPSQPCLSGS